MTRKMLFYHTTECNVDVIDESCIIERKKIRTNYCSMFVTIPTFIEIMNCYHYTIIIIVISRYSFLFYFTKSFTFWTYRF